MVNPKGRRKALEETVMQLKVSCNCNIQVKIWNFKEFSMSKITINKQKLEDNMEVQTLEVDCKR